MGFSENKTRILSAGAGITIVFVLYVFFRQIGVQLITSAIALMAYYEFLKISQQKKNAIIIAMFFAALASYKLIWLGAGISHILYASLFIFLTYALWLSHNEPAPAPSEQLQIHIQNAFLQIAGLFYIIGFISFVPRLHALSSGPSYLLYLLLLIWGGDSAAYYVGKRVGKHKLSINISPGKTVEGTLGAALFCLLLSIPVHFFLLPHVTILKLAVIAIIISISAQIGDLLESLIKRGAQVKDSGAIMPGHGGMFDRFDSLIFAVPIYYFLVKIFACC